MLGWVEVHLWRRAVPDVIPYTDPLRAGRHPMQTFLLVLCVISGMPLLFGQTTAGSIEEALPNAVALLWGLSLVLGSTVALTGAYWRGKSDTALTLERMGLDVAGLAAVCYAFIIFSVGGLRSLVAAALVLGFGLVCLRRARDIARIFQRAKNGEE